MISHPIFKGLTLPANASGEQDQGVRERSLGKRVLHGELPLPLAVIKQSAMQHNLNWMQSFCRERGLDLAPHGKTTLSPELFRRQLAAGAWGVSFATVTQAAVGASAGVRNIIIANQVLQRVDLDGLAHLLESHAGLSVFFLVDSLAQLRAIETWHRQSKRARRLTVLLEIGIAGKRTGCRTHAQAMDLARSIARSPAVSLHGIESYEGALASDDSKVDRINVAELMQRVRDVAEACDREDLFHGNEVLLTAGGSAIFDLVADHLDAKLSKPFRKILRSGCYLTHDHGEYTHRLRFVAERLRVVQTLRPALEVVTVVQSCPEPGLALLAMGKRDAGYDLALPVPLWHCATGDPDTEPAPGHWHISAMNDQHAYLRFDATSPPSEHPSVMQVVGSGISHPCTTFDKWRWMPIVDDTYCVVDAITTHF